MKLEEQVCSLELAKRLKELGVKQDSYFYWVETPIITPPQYELGSAKEIASWAGPYEKANKISAFTVAELGKMLPKKLEHLKQNPNLLRLEFGFQCDISIAYYYDTEMTNKRIELSERDKAEANARAKMLIYLIENNIIKGEEL